MQVDIITKGELSGFVEGELFRQLTVLPLSTLRANYFINAPHIQPNDPLVILVRDGVETLSFALFLPDITKQGQRFAWNSGWWVHPGKGKPYALLPLLKGIELWDEKVAFADLPERSSQILEALNRFVFLPKHDGLKLVLTPYLPKSIGDNVATKVLNKVGRLFSFAPLWSIGHRTFKLNAVDILTGSIDEFIRSVADCGLTQRDASDFWNIMSYLWMSIDSNNDILESQRYPFSLISRDFSLRFFEMTDNSERKVLVVFKVRDGHLTVPYLFAKDENLPKAVSTILNYAISSRFKSITVFRRDVVALMLPMAPLLAPQKRIGSQTAFGRGMQLTNLQNLMLHDGEGDCIFT